MKTYILKRLAGMVPMLLGVSLLAFVLMQLAPGDPLSAQRNNPQVSEELIQSLEHEYGFDRSIPVQYGLWLGKLVRGDLGYSFRYKQPVSQVIADRVQNTLILTLFSFVVTWMLAVPIGVWCAVRRNQWPDRLASAIAFTGMSLPSFFLALLMLYFATLLPPLPLIGQVPIAGISSPDHDSMSALGKVRDILMHLLIPGTVLAIGGLAGMQRLTRGAFLDTLSQPFVLAARARGLGGGRVLWGHAFRNAANPLITLLGFEFSSLLSGAAFVEIITSWPGLGLVALEAVRSNDMFLVMASVLIGSVMLLVGNLLADLLLAWNDPRVQLR